MKATFLNVVTMTLIQKWNPLDTEQMVESFHEMVKEA